MFNGNTRQTMQLNEQRLAEIRKEVNTGRVMNPQTALHTDKKREVLFFTHPILATIINLMTK